MKKIFLTLISVIVLATTTVSQIVNQITISPANPTANDTINIISNFSYYGNCSFGLVHYYTYLVNPVIDIIPTYCGYGDTMLCNSIDTFKIGPYPVGNYTISIQYHQGSICPVSGFDAIIAQSDTSVTVSGTSGISFPKDINLNSLNIFPNPFSSSTNLQSDQLLNNAILTVYNSIGQQVKQIKNISGQTVILKREKLSSGLYFVQLKQNNKIITTNKLVIMD